MSGMNQALAEFFGNASEVASDETMSKQAEVELFCKLAAEQGVDLNAMTDEQVEALYAGTFGTKEAESDDEKKKRLEAEAREEHEGKKEAEAKFAEAALAGQIMAHSMWAELQEIQKEAGAKEDAYTGSRKALSTARDLYDSHVGSKLHNAKQVLGGERIKHIKGQLGDVAERAKDVVDPAHEGSTKSLTEALRSERFKTHGSRAALATGAAGATGGGLAIHKHNKNKAEAAAASTPAAEEQKAASAFNLVAAESAYTKMASVGWDAEEVASRLNAVLTLGFDDSETKTAGVQDYDTAVEIRSLELAELAGYPVEWA